MKHIPYFLILTLFLNCKNEDKKTTNIKTESSDYSKTSIIDINFDNKNILSTLFSSNEFTKSGSYIRFKPSIEEKTVLPISDNNFGYAKLDSLIYFKKENKEYAVAILLTENIVDEANDYSLDCHACRPTIGLALFSHDNNTWNLEKFKKFVETSGSWGKRGIIKLIKLAEEKHGLMVISSNSGMGSAQEITKLYSLDEFGYFDEIFTVPTFDSTTGAYEKPEDTHEIKKDINIDVINQKIIVKTEGFLENNKKINLTENFIFSEVMNSYIPI